MACEITRDANGSMTRIVCGRSGAKKCPFCHKLPATKLCDFHTVGNKTCDLPFCEQCGKNVGPDRDYCPNHATERRPVDNRSLVNIAWDDLQSETCYCRAKKRKKQSFCSKCYYTLPRDKQHELYTPMSDGYAAIYEECKEILKGEGRGPQ